MSVVEELVLEPPTFAQRARRGEPLVYVLSGILVLIVLCALFAPLLAPYPPNQGNILAANLGPSGAHWLGTDQLGRDILSRLLYGARLSLLGRPAPPVLFQDLTSKPRGALHAH